MKKRTLLTYRNNINNITPNALPKFYIQKLRKINCNSFYSPQTQARPTSPESYSGLGFGYPPLKRITDYEFLV